METVAECKRCRSLGHTVLSSEDLLIEILLRLPVLSIFKFKSVSKRWLSIINSPDFILRRNQNPTLEPPSGLFLQLPSLSTAYDFVRLDSTNKSSFHTSFFPFGYNVEILHSCNGLLLCCISPYNFIVYNPSTYQFKLLPNKHFSKLDKVRNGIKLAFDPTKSHHYKVIYVKNIYLFNYVTEIHTYSSETGNWSFYQHSFRPTHCFSDFGLGVYWNGAIYWPDLRGLHFKLDVKYPVLTTIRKPGNLDGRNHYDHKLFESRGCLLLVCIVVYKRSPNSRQVNVYEMRNRCPKWSVKYVIDFDDIMMLIPWEMPDKQLYVRCVVVGEREEDSFLVLEVFGKVVRYNIVLKTLSKIYEFSPHVMEAFGLHCFPFIPSLAYV